MFEIPCVSGEEWLISSCINFPIKYFHNLDICAVSGTGEDLIDKEIAEDNC